MEHSKAMKKLQSLYRAKGRDMRAVVEAVRASADYPERQHYPAGVVVYTTGSEWDGIVVGDAPTAGRQVLANHVGREA